MKIIPGHFLQGDWREIIKLSHGVKDEDTRVLHGCHGDGICRLFLSHPGKLEIPVK